MEIINAQNLGIYFNLKGSEATGFRGLLQNAFKPGTTEAFWAIDDLSFTLNKGEILGVVGNNGAGKSTLLRAIAGVYKPDRGSLEVSGSISPLLSLGTGFKMELSGRENVFLNGSIMGFNDNEVKQNLNDIIEFAELKKFFDMPVKNYSSGMRSRLGFAIAVHLKRDIMLVDEILGVGDFRFRQKSQERLGALINDGRTIVIVSHDLSSIKKYATKALWLNQGKKVMLGGTEEVVEAYLKS